MFIKRLQNQIPYVCNIQIRFIEKIQNASQILKCLSKILTGDNILSIQEVVEIKNKCMYTNFEISIKVNKILPKVKLTFGLKKKY